MAQSFNVLKEFGGVDIANGGILRLGNYLDGVELSFDGTSTMTFDAATANDEISFGASTATDVRLNGATAGADILWDASADQMIVTDNASIRVGDAADGFVLQFDGTTTLNIDPATANDVIRIGETTQADFQVDGATDLVWDASVGSLVNGGFFVPVIPNAIREVIAAGGTSTAMSVANFGSDVAVDAGGDIFTLADGTVVGQLKQVTLDATAGGIATITPATFVDGTSATLTTAGDFATFMWVGATGWRLVGGRGVAVI